MEMSMTKGASKMVSPRLTSAQKIEAEKTKKRVEELKELFQYSLYSNICRSIFEKDKLLFSFLLTVKILQSQGKLSDIQYELLTCPISGTENPIDMPNPATDWMSPTIWNKLCEYANKDRDFMILVTNFRDTHIEWKKLFDCERELEDDIYPKNECSADGKWTAFQKLCLLKVLRPDKLPNAIKDFVSVSMGLKFLVPPEFDMEASFNDSSAATPIIFIMPGNDPLKQLGEFCLAKRKQQLKSISLGQGMSKRAEKYIENAEKKGEWVLLQNCHLYPSWMQKLQQICE